MNGDVRIHKGSARPSAKIVRGSRITAAALDGQRGLFDRLVGALQEKHGWNRERAAKELLRRLGRQRANQSKRTCEYELVRPASG